MNLDRHQQARFSASAPVYDQAAHVQRAVGDRLIQGLAFLGDARRVLDIGCGTGNLTRQLAETWPRAEVIGIDHAPGMIAEARRRNRGAARPVFEAADALSYSTARPFDLLFSSSALHWLHPLGPALRALARLLAPGGAFAFALMLRGTLRELHDTRAEIAADNLPVRSMPDEDAFQSELAGAGLRVMISEVEAHLTRAVSARELIRQLRTLGVTGGPLSRARRPMRRGELERLYALYDARYRDEKGVYATYRVGYFWGTRDV